MGEGDGRRAVVDDDTEKNIQEKALKITKHMYLVFFFSNLNQNKEKKLKKQTLTGERWMTAHKRRS